MIIFLRMTSNKAGKFRPDWFSYEGCFNNLLSVLDDDNEKKEKLFVFFDGDPKDHFISNYPDVNIIRTDGGSETKSFTNLLDHIKENLKDEDENEIIYFLEDDYLHRPGAMKILREAFENIQDIKYVTLYDHADKYFPGYFDQFAVGFPTQLIFTESVHWRTTPSTTNTFATRLKTLREDFETHYKFSSTGTISEDHKKFHALWLKGRNLISPIPGYSTHCENMLMSPTIDWEKIQ